MGLKLLMTQFLSKLWTRSNPSTQLEPESVLPELPEALGGDEYVARYIFHPRYIYKTGEQAGRVKPQGFKPECYQGNWETSVCRTTGVSHSRIWEISRICRAPAAALARADVGMDAVHSAELMAQSVPIPHYDEHAVILGWPVNHEKDAHMMLMVKLATAADTLQAPSAI